MKCPECGENLTLEGEWKYLDEKIKSSWVHGTCNLCGALIRMEDRNGSFVCKELPDIDYLVICA